MERGFLVKVRGRLDARFGTVFGPTHIESDGDNTVVRGHFRDQSNLDGILAYFRDLGMELVAVETWDEAPTSTATEHESIRWEREK